MKDKINISVKGKVYDIPNSWDAMSPEVFCRFAHYLRKVETGEMAVGMLRIHVLCDLMGWNLHKMRDEEQLANLVVLSEQMTFLFKIQYPDDNAALQTLTDEEYSQAIRIEPEHLNIPQREQLMQLDYRYKPDLCFFRQMIPTVKAGDMTCFGYKAEMSHDSLTTSLTALQYIEAHSLLSKPKSLPLLAAVLYAPEPYNSRQAHSMAADFEQLDAATLQAVRMNFEAVNNFLFQKTDFSLLTKFEKGKAKAISTDWTDALYDLSKDGLGNASEVEQLNILTYLRILRKNTINSVRQLHGMKMELAKIAEETGLPIEIVTKII